MFAGGKSASNVAPTSELVRLRAFFELWAIRRSETGLVKRGDRAKRPHDLEARLAE